MDSDNIYNLIFNILTKSKLPSHDELFEITDCVSGILENEITDYRTVAKNASPGSFIDLSENNVPMIVVPDLHARPQFLKNILDFKFSSEKTVFNALYNHEINLIFVGDILHSERNTRERWEKIEEEFERNEYTGTLMTEEMSAGLSLLYALLKLKEIFPENCHILKGNHENIMNSTGNGDYSFLKYAEEGDMCKTFIQQYYGDDILYMIHCVERALPLLALGPRCVVSHAEPEKFYSKEELINARLTEGVVEGLTWTANNEAEDESAIKIVKGLVGDSAANDYVYIAGHRPVAGKYNLRQDGYFIQIHNPAQQNIAIVNSDRKFNPETDIFEVNK